MRNCLNKNWKCKKGKLRWYKKVRERHCSDPRLGVKERKMGSSETRQSKVRLVLKLWSLFLSSLVLGAQVLRGCVLWNRVSDIWGDMVRLFLLKKWRLNPTAVSEKKAVAEAKLTGTSSKQRRIRPFSSQAFLVPLHARHWQKLKESDGKAQM